MNPLRMPLMLSALHASAELSITLPTDDVEIPPTSETFAIASATLPLADIETLPNFDNDYGYTAYENCRITFHTNAYTLYM